MTNKSHFIPLLFVMALACMASCGGRGGKGENDTLLNEGDSLADNYVKERWSLIPVSFDGQSWSMIDTAGNILLKNEFPQMPTLPYYGYFSMPDKDGLFTVYELSDTGYRAVKNLTSLYAAGYMEDDRIPIVRESGRIEIYDSRGEKKFVALPIDSLEVTSTYSGYSDGMLCFRLADGHIGFYDTEGRVAVKSIYDEVSFFSDGLAIAGIRKDSIECDYEVIDKTGQTVFKLPKGERPSLLYNKGFNNGYLIATNDSSFFLYDREGKKISFPQQISKIEEVNSKYVIFRDKYDDWGIGTLDGDIFVLPQFSFITFAGAYGPFGGTDLEKGFFACGDTESFLLNEKGEIIKEYRDRQSLPFGQFGIFSFDDNKFSLMGLDGKLKHSGKFLDLNISSLAPYDLIESLYLPE